MKTCLLILAILAAAPSFAQNGRGTDPYGTNDGSEEARADANHQEQLQPRKKRRRKPAPPPAPPAVVTVGRAPRNRIDDSFEMPEEAWWAGGAALAVACVGFGFLIGRRRAKAV